MRDIVAVLAILGGIIEAITAVGGPQMAGVGMLTGDPAPPMPTGPLLVGLAVAVLSVVAGWRVSAGRSGLVWGAAMLAGAAVGILIVGPDTGFFTIASAFTILAGIVALFVRTNRRAI